MSLILFADDAGMRVALQKGVEDPVGVGSVSVRVRPDLTVLVSTSTPFAVGQMISVAIPGGNLSSAQIIGGAAGSAPRIRQVVV